MRLSQFSCILNLNMQQQNKISYTNIDCNHAKTTTFACHPSPSQNKNRNPVCRHLLQLSQGRIQARYPPTTPSGTLLRAPFRASVITGRFTRLAAPPCDPPFRGGHAEGLDVWRRAGYRHAKPRASSTDAAFRASCFPMC